MYSALGKMEITSRCKMESLGPFGGLKVEIASRHTSHNELTADKVTDEMTQNQHKIIWHGLATFRCLISKDPHPVSHRDVEQQFVPRRLERNRRDLHPPGAMSTSKNANNTKTAKSVFVNSDKGFAYWATPSAGSRGLAGPWAQSGPLCAHPEGLRDRLSLSSPTTKHIRTHTQAHTSTGVNMWKQKQHVCLAPLPHVVRKRTPAISAASAYNKSIRQSQESQKDQQARTSAHLHLRRLNPPARMAKGSVVGHALPLCANPVTAGTENYTSIDCSIDPKQQ